MFDEFGALADEHEEFTDSDVREAVHRTLTRYFVWGITEEELPVSYGMWSAEGDARVRGIIGEFLRCVLHEVLPIGQPRLAMLQDRRIQASNGMEYDELFGHRDNPLPLAPLPAHMYTTPRYDR
ncbi:MAG TPA: hypothetical protein VER96_01860 [Polyangiaceae bacterium]|nr:hypothetical protein [Polyangiaceae bacterium]